MTDNTQKQQTAVSAAPASQGIRPPAPAVKPSGNLTYTIEKGADALPWLKKWPFWR
jgi:hypothetical protein